MGSLGDLFLQPLFCIMVQRQGAIRTSLPIRKDVCRKGIAEFGSKGLGSHCWRVQRGGERNSSLRGLMT